MPDRPKSGWNIQRITTHPGEMLLEEFMLPLSISQNRLAADLRVPPGRINQIINGKRAITSDTTLRLAKYFSNSPEFWMDLQTMHDLSKTRTEHGKRIEQEVRPAKRIA
jgi:antitoxin HigA-1